MKQPQSATDAQTTSEAPLRVIDLGRMAYAEAFAEQRRLNQAVIDGNEPDTLLLVEHEPVITLSYRKSAAQHLLAPRERLAQLGIDVQETDRGGDVTYHGPGQLVVYPILRLAPLRLNLSRYMRLLEQIVIDTLAAFDVHSFREEGATGVWVKSEQMQVQAVEKPPDNSPPETRNLKPAKICAMGVRIRKNVTMHGLALNVNPDLSHFNTIVPCGLHDRHVTSLEQELGERAPTMEIVKRAIVAQMQNTVAALRRERD